jgi:protocatechuate 3,4-dioxygenase alpha subunit
LSVSVFDHPLLSGLLGDEEAANAEDPILARIEHRVRVPTLIAQREGNVYTFDIRLQGEDETIFFDI